MGRVREYDVTWDQMVKSDQYRLSHSEIQTFKRCRRKWYLQYHLRWRKRDRTVRLARETGIIVHGALHEYYKNGHDEDAAVAWMKEQREVDLAAAQQSDTATILDSYKTAGVVVDGYFEWLTETGADAHIQVVGSETTLEAPSPVPDVTLFGIIDLIGTHTKTQDIVVLDTKVVQSIEDTVRTLSLNEQALMYALLAKVNDPNPDRGFRVIWSMLKRSKRTTRATPPFYDRYELVISPGQLEMFYEQLRGVIEQILQLEAVLELGGVNPNQVAYPTPTKDCSWECDFYNVCPAMNDPSADPNWLLNQYYVQGGNRPVAGTVVEVNQRPKEVSS